MHINNINTNDNTGLASLNTHENEAASASIFLFHIRKCHISSHFSGTYKPNGTARTTALNV